VKLFLTVDGEEQQIEILAKGDECRFRMGEAEHSATVEVPRPGVYSILMDGQSHDARVEEIGTATVVTLAGYRFEIQVRDPRRWSPKSASGAQGTATLTSPMPGKVVRVLIAAGDEVKAGQGILVVEAMKMQNEIKAPRAGKVVSLSAREGATVTAGEALATIG
jgi:biotin carboxyl carrier protein